MTYDVKFSEKAEAEVDQTFFWLLGRSSEWAGTWLKALHESVGTLSEFPTRCPLARESILFDSPVRCHLFRDYRILFSLIDADDDGVEDTVWILHIRHGARSELTSESQ